VKDITDGEDILNVGAVLSVASELAIALSHKSSIGQVESSSDGVATDGEEDSVEGVTLLSLPVLPEDGDGAVFGSALQASWSGAMDELSVIVAHVLTNQISHILIEAAQ